MGSPRRLALVVLNRRREEAPRAAGQGMATSFFSSNWHRVAHLKPRIRAHVHFHRQVFRGTVWYVVQDNLTGRHHRLSAATHRIVALMDGERTVEEIWTEAGRLLGDEQPTQDDVVRLLGLLHNADLVFGGTRPHMDELGVRARRIRSRDFWSRLKNPMSLRFRLVDPDRFLARTMPFVAPLFTVWGALAWGLLVLVGLIVALVQADAMAGAVLDRVLTAESIAIMLIAYPLIKALHELGHAYATRHGGGEVHELGVMLLVLMPVPYVDASASAAFPDPRRRALVGAAGILVELAIAAIAVIVWALAEPGFVRALALDVALIGGVSTILFNGNPLLRFDGYWVLSDLIEIPNLAQRANRWIFHQIQRRAFGIPDLETPVTAPGEAPWFLFYAVASFLYRMSVVVAIAMTIAGHFFLFGVAVALAMVIAAVVLPLVKGARFLLLDPRLAERRPRVLAVTGGALAVVVVLFALVPFPYATPAVGVVWVADGEATVRARVEGFVSALHPAADVAPGEVLVRMSDPRLAARTVLAERRLDELRIRLEAVGITDRPQANVLREQIRNDEGQLADMRRALADLDVAAATPGRFLPSDPIDGLGRFHRRGDVLGWLIGANDLVVRVVVPQTEIDLVRRTTRAVDVRLAGADGATLAGTIVRDVPAALAELPHPALSTRGGGPFPVDPARTDVARPLETVFEVDVRVADLPPAARLGMRAHVRFEHPSEALATRLARAVRQIFLRRFNV